MPRKKKGSLEKLFDAAKGNPLTATMVLQASEGFAREVIKNKEVLREKMSNSFVHPEAWIASAEQIAGVLDYNQ